MLQKFCIRAAFMEKYIISILQNKLTVAWHCLHIYHPIISFVAHLPIGRLRSAAFRYFRLAQ